MSGEAVRGGTRRIRLAGPEGLRGVPTGWRLEADNPGAFQGEIAVLDLNVALLGVIAVTAHRAAYRPPPAAPHRAGDLTVALVTNGTLLVRRSDGEEEVPRGSLLLRRSADPLVYRAPAGMRMLMATARNMDAGPASEREPTPTLLPPTRLNSAFAAMLRQFCTTPFTHEDETSHYLERVLVEVLQVVAGEQFQRDREESALRTRIVRYIDGNLTDPDLGPHSIAAALGVSLRLVHSGFNRGDETVARWIKHKRLDRTAALLRSGSMLRVEDLATAVGYAGPAQLSRAFAARFGTTISRYRANPPKG